VPVTFNLGEGLYAFEIAATDDAGNVFRDALADAVPLIGPYLGDKEKLRQIAAKIQPELRRVCEAILG